MNEEASMKRVIWALVVSIGSVAGIAQAQAQPAARHKLLPVQTPWPQPRRPPARNFVRTASAGWLDP